MGVEGEKRARRRRWKWGRRRKGAATNSRSDPNPTTFSRPREDSSRVVCAVARSTMGRLISKQSRRRALWAALEKLSIHAPMSDVVMDAVWIRDDPGVVSEDFYDDGFSIACDDCSSRWCNTACFDGHVPEEWRRLVCVLGFSNSRSLSYYVHIPHDIASHHDHEKN
ncbi:hypothetical protein F5887DRAFT_342543 [Amanita rubescens]|nr:hypothetical protein F5887DRAFT_342543 [Amanita rubescens]